MSGEVLVDFATLLGEIGVTGEEALVACGEQGDVPYTVFRDWGLSTVNKIAANMPDLASKLAILREVISMF